MAISPGVLIVDSATQHDATCLPSGVVRVIRRHSATAVPSFGGTARQLCRHSAAQHNSDGTAQETATAQRDSDGTGQHNATAFRGLSESGT